MDTPKQRALRSLITAIIVVIFTLLIDYCRESIDAFHNYLIHGVLLSIILYFAFYLEDTGRDSWKWLFSHFKKKKDSIE